MINNVSEFIYDVMNDFMFKNNYIMSENFRYLSTKYRILIYEWRGDPSRIMKYYYLNNLTVEQTIIVSHVQDLIDMRDHSNYEHINETELKHLLFELCCN